MKTFSISTVVVEGRVTKKLTLNDDSDLAKRNHSLPIYVSGKDMEMLTRKNIAKFLADGYKPE